MCFPLALGDFGIAEHGAEGGILRAAGVNAEQDFTALVPQMADAELRKMDAVATAFHAVITLLAAQPVPHFFHIGGNVGGGPIGIPVVCHDAAQSLEAFVFIFDGSFQPVFTVQINGHTALVEAVFAFELRFHRERKIGLLRSDLKHGGIVILKSVVGTLPEIGVGLRHNLHGVLCKDHLLWFSCPDQVLG